MKIAIIETGEPAMALQEQYGTYAMMFRHAFRHIDAMFSFETFPVFSSLKFPSHHDFAGVLITGSPFGVYEGHAFITPLEGFIRDWMQYGKPVAGICFGHQIMAQALGGRVEKSQKGWGVGVHTYEIIQAQHELPEWFGRHLINGKDHLNCVLSHQDQVVEATNDMVQLAGSDFCPNGALLYANGLGVSFQMHPEFNHDFAADLLTSREDRMPAETVATARWSFDQETDRYRMMSMLRDFFLSHSSTYTDDDHIPHGEGR